MCVHLVPGAVALLGNVLTFGLLRHATRESAMQFVFMLAMMFLGIATAQGRSLTDLPPRRFGARQTLADTGGASLDGC
jgi:hypothetical protein